MLTARSKKQILWIYIRKRVRNGRREGIDGAPRISATPLATALPHMSAMAQRPNASTCVICMGLLEQNLREDVEQRKQTVERSAKSQLLPLGLDVRSLTSHQHTRFVSPTAYMHNLGHIESCLSSQEAGHDGSE